jgi:hypothetical protein
MAFGIAKEIDEEACEENQWHGAGVADGQSRRRSKSGRATDKWKPCPIEPHSIILVRNLRRLAAMASKDIFHLVLQLQFDFLEFDFFDLLDV